MQKLFLPYLTNDQGKSLDVENGTVVPKALPTSLDNAPEGWEGNIVQWARNNEFRALILSFITNLKFYLEGAQILRDAFYRKGIEAVLYFILLKQNLAFGAGMHHESWYKGEPDFATFKDTHDGVEINIAEGGFYKQLQANKGIVYEMPMQRPEMISIYHDGLELTQKTNYSVLPLEDADSGAVGFEDLKTIPVIILNKEGISGSVVTKDQAVEQIDIGDTTYMANSQNYFAINNGEVNVTVNMIGTIDFRCIAESGTSNFSIYFKSTGGYTHSLFSVLNISNGATYSYPFSISRTMEPNEKLFLFASFDRVGFGSAAVEYLDTSLFNVHFVSRFKATTFNAYRVFDVGNYLVNQMSDGQSSLSGSLLSDDYNLMVASGDMIRGIAGSVIKTKFTDWHKSVDALKCVALDIVNNNPVIQSRYDKFTDTTIHNLGECRNFSLDVAHDYIYNEFHVGYPNQENTNYDSLNGKYEFNTTLIFKAPVTRVKNTYDAVSVYRADPTGIEYIRINLEGKLTTDNKSDNDNFFIDCEPAFPNYVGDLAFNSVGNLVVVPLDGLDLQLNARFRVLIGQNAGYYTVLSASEPTPANGTTTIIVQEPVVTENIHSEIVWLHYKLRRIVYDSVTGIPNPDSIFNVEISPKSNAGNHYRWWHSACDHMEDKSLTFQSTDKNPALSRTLAGVTITETADIPISTMGAKVFLPYYLNAEFKSPHNLLDIMTANNSGHFDFTMGGVELEGFPIEIKTEEAYLETQNWKMLASANCDLTKLILNR